MIPYRAPIHNNNCIITINQHIHRPKLISISCRFTCLNLIIFLSIQLPIAANQHTRYIHKENNKMVLNMVIKFQNQIGSHFMCEWINQKIHAHIHNHQMSLLNFVLELANRYNTGNINTHSIDAITIHRFCVDDKISL